MGLKSIVDKGKITAILKVAQELMKVSAPEIIKRGSPNLSSGELVADEFIKLVNRLMQADFWGGK